MTMTPTGLAMAWLEEHDPEMALEILTKLEGAILLGGDPKEQLTEPEIAAMYRAEAAVGIAHLEEDGTR